MVVSKLLSIFVYQNGKTMTQTIITITKIASAQPMGQYNPTSVDATKAAVDFRLIQVSPKVITWSNGKTEKVTDRKFDTLRNNHTWATDF